MEIFKDYFDEKFKNNRCVKFDSIIQINDDTCIIDYHRIFKHNETINYAFMILLHTNNEIKEIVINDSNYWVENENMREKRRNKMKQFIEAFILYDRWDYQKSNFMNVFDDIISFEDVKELSLDEVREILTKDLKLDKIESHDDFMKKFGFRIIVKEIPTWEKEYEYRNFKFKLTLTRKFNIEYRGESKHRKELSEIIEIKERKNGSSKYYDYHLDYECLNRDDWEILDSIFNNMHTISKFIPIYENKIYKNIYEEENSSEHLRPIFVMLIRDIIMHINWIQNTTTIEIAKQKQILNNQEKAFEKMRG